VNTVTVRPAQADDYDAIVAVADVWWGRPISPSLPRLFLDHFHADSRVAHDGGGIAGFLVAFVSPSQPATAYIHFVGVRPDLRGGGLARSLYEDFFGRAEQAGCRVVRAITGPGNSGSIAFHRRLGFAVSDPVPDYNGPGRAMVTFARPLGAPPVAS
jgi:predicted GNAT superfamily acetyltransferase